MGTSRASKDEVLDSRRDIHESYQKIIHAYTGFVEPFTAWMRFFQDSTSQEEIVMHCRHAAPLEQIEDCIREAAAKKEVHLLDTLIRAIVQAIRDGDVSIIDNEGHVLYEGLADRLLQLCKELYSEEIFLRCLEKVRLEVRIEEKQEDAEQLNRDAIRQVFDAIKKNDENTEAVITNFNEWAKTTSVLNRIHLIHVARMELSDRGHELRSLYVGDRGGCYGVLGDRFCYRVTGALQKDLSSRMQQLLAYGLYYLFRAAKQTKLVRFVDLDASSFIRVSGSNRELGVSAFYDEYGFVGGKLDGEGFYTGSRGWGVGHDYNTCYKKLCDSVQYLLHSKYSKYALPHIQATR